MGSVYSQLADSSEATMDSADYTPSKKAPNVRLLTLDPRSPSNEIDRTPIVVDRTPDTMANRQKRVVLLDTPTSAPFVLDPRSPTTAFTRTPINPGYSTSAVQHISPLSVTHTVTSATELASPDITDLESSRMSSVQLDDELFEESSNSFDDSFGSFNISEQEHLEHQRHSPSLWSDCSMISPTDIMEVGNIPRVAEVSQVHSDSDLLQYHARATKISTNRQTASIQPGSNFQVPNKPKMFSLALGSTRSPLSAVGNSPRVLLQRKGMLQQAGKTPESPFVVKEDKENVPY